MSSMLDDVFDLLEAASCLEKKKTTRIEAATKYYEAVYLMKRYLQRLPRTPQQMQTRQLLNEKIIHYEKIASDTLAIASNDKNMSTRSVVGDSRSPIAITAGGKFFNEDSSGSSGGNNRGGVHHPVMMSSLSAVPPPPPRKLPTSPPQLISSAYVNEKAGKANMKLSYALDLDENAQTNIKTAIQAYTEAAELYLEALKAAEKTKHEHGGGVTSVLSRRLEHTLDRIEQLKNPNKNKTKPEKNLKHEQHQRGRTSLSSSSSSPTPPPTSLSFEEVSVLTRSSLIASGLFLPWSDHDAQELSCSAAVRLSKITLFADPSGLLTLSDKQQKRFHMWARPSEIIHLRKKVVGTSVNKAPVMVLKSVSPYNIRQQGVTDCSFIASLCICAAFERRFKKRVITSILYPQTKDGTPFYNPQGKYMVKLWLNGVARQVIVDDRLPIDQYGNLLCAHTDCPSTELELWVSIIEKAYMKLCGGYDFPGSNSGVDLFSLTGWIPERIVFAKNPVKVLDHETPRERAWERLFSASSYGDCLITMSSESKLSDAEAETIGLYTGHAYAVLSVIQTTNGTRLLQLKNPWAYKGWKGRFSSGDTVSWRDPKFCAEVGYNAKLAAKKDDGVFWICWEDILKYFQNIHLSWNPALFSHRVSTHGFWPKEQGPFDDTFNCGENPQYLLHLSGRAVEKKATIWLLISRHVTRQEQEGSEATDFLTLHLVRNMKSNDRIWYSGGRNCVFTGAYTNNPHNLVRYDVESAEDANLSIVLSQYEKKHDLGYTLSCFCTEPFTIGRPATELPFVTSLSSSWTTHTAGGPIGTQVYYDNPMFAFAVPEGGATIQLRCSTMKTLAVNVIVVPVNTYGCRVNRIKSEPPIDSGNYRHGFVATDRKKLAQGFYTLIVSSYSHGVVGNFHVKVCSSVKLTVDRII